MDEIEELTSDMFELSENLKSIKDEFERIHEKSWKVIDKLNK